MSADFNGLEFLECGTSVEDVERKLAERNIEEFWKEEVEKRYKNYIKGKAKTFQYEKVINK